MRYRDVYPKWRIQENPSPAHAKKRGKLFPFKEELATPLRRGSPDARFLPRLLANSTLPI